MGNGVAHREPRFFLTEEGIAEAATFLANGLTPDTLWRQIFDLAYMQDGTGLGLSISEVMELEAAQKDRLLSMLCEALDERRAAMEAATRRIGR